MGLSTNMVYWSVSVKSIGSWADISRFIAPYVKSIRVKQGLASNKKLTKSKTRTNPSQLTGGYGHQRTTSPSELEIQIISHSYIEGTFTPGTQIKVWMGYDRLFQPLVFEGTITSLPDGGAKEMMTYNVKAYSSDISFAFKERNKSFVGFKKAEIIAEIALFNNILAPIISIKDITPIKQKYAPIQQCKTDMEMLDRLAKEWKCKWWVDRAGLFYFMDDDNCYNVNDLKNAGLPYTLGYRTDKFGIKNNVQSIDWTQNVTAGGSAIMSMLEGTNESGPDLAAKKYKINALGATWQLQPQYKKMAEEDPMAFRKYLGFCIGQTAAGNGYDVLRTFFEVLKATDTTNNGAVPGNGEATGIELTIHLNEGDPYLEAPRTGLLYHGAENIRMDAKLPNWLFTEGVGWNNGAVLNINETVLTYDDGLLKSELKCSIRGKVI